MWVRDFSCNVLEKLGGDETARVFNWLKLSSAVSIVPRNSKLTTFFGVFTVTRDNKISGISLKM
jgi:hypothetical protein